MGLPINLAKTIYIHRRKSNVVEYSDGFQQIVRRMKKVK